MRGSSQRQPHGYGYDDRNSPPMMYPSARGGAYRSHRSPDGAVDPTANLHELMYEISDVVMNFGPTAVSGGRSPPNAGRGGLYGVPVAPLPIGQQPPHGYHRDTSPQMDNDTWMHLMLDAAAQHHQHHQQQQHVDPAYQEFDPWNQHGAANRPTMRGRGGDANRQLGRGGRGRGQRGGANAPRLGQLDPAVLAVSTTDAEALKQAGAAQGQAAAAGGDAGSNAQSPLAPNRIYAVVEFKNQRLKRYEVGQPTHVSPGQYVIVEGDRGEDCGLVVLVGRTAHDGTLHIQKVEGTTVNLQKLKTENGRVLRVATSTEVDTLHHGIATLEQQALKACRERCEELGIEIKVIDCEYQFDGKKISFFYDSDHSIDYRDLVKDLFKMFGARIWMENVNTKVKNVVPTGALSRHQKVAAARGGGGGGYHRHH